MKNYPLQAWFLLIMLSIIWGASFFFIKKGLIFLSPLEVGSLRIASAAIFLVPFAIQGFKIIPRDKIFLVLMVGFIGSFFPSLLISLAQTNLDSGIAGTMNSTAPLFTLVIGSIFFKQNIKLFNIVGIIIGLLGTTFLILGRLSFSTLERANHYSFFIILATFLYAINLNLVENKLKDIPSLSLTAVSFVGCGFFSVIILLTNTNFLKHLGNFSATSSSIFYVVILGLVNTALAMVVFNKIIKLTNSLFTSSATYLVPLVSLFIGSLDGEKLAFFQFLSMGFILLGISLVNKK